MANHASNSFMGGSAGGRNRIYRYDAGLLHTKRRAGGR